MPSPTIAAKLRQIAHGLEMDGDALENIVSGEGLTEVWQEACVAPTRDVAKPPHNAGDRHLRSERNSDAAFSDCLDAIQQGVDAALHWPRPQIGLMVRTSADGASGSARRRPDRRRPQS